MTSSLWCHRRRGALKDHWGETWNDLTNAVNAIVEFGQGMGDQAAGLLDGLNNLYAISSVANDAKNNDISKLQAAPLSRLNAKLGELNKRRQAALANGNGNGNDEENVSLEPVWKAL